jgi:hypothetical protein
MKFEIYPEHLDDSLMSEALKVFYTQAKLDPVITNTPYGYHVIVNVSDLQKDEVELIVYSILSKHRNLLESPCKFTIINNDEKVEFELDVC